MPRGVVQEELEAAVQDVFDELGDFATVVLRRYARGTTPGSAVSGQQARLPVGEPIEAMAILSWRDGKGQEGIADLFVRPTSLGDDVNLTNPDYEWTVQEPGAVGELDLKPAREGGKVWRPFGPQPRNPILWKGRVVDGGDPLGV